MLSLQCVNLQSPTKIKIKILNKQNKKKKHPQRTSPISHLKAMMEGDSGDVSEI